MSAKKRILQALEGAGSRGCTTIELCQPSVGGKSFSQRIFDLRKDGYVIEEQGKAFSTDHRYWLRGKPARTSPITPVPVPGPVETPDDGMARLFSLPSADESVERVRGPYEDWEDAA